MKRISSIARSFTVSGTLAITLVLAACGGGSGSAGGGSSTSSGGGGTNGGGGGGGGAPTLSISLLSPATIMTGVNLGFVNVYGQGFNSQSQVYIDGVPAVETAAGTGSPIQAELPLSLGFAAGVHQVTVHNADGTVSNPLPFTVYSPQNGPQVMQAIPAFLVADYAVDPTFITTADLNGDGLSDVIMPGPNIGNSGSIAIFYGQADGNLSTVQYVPAQITPYAAAAGDVDGDGNADLVLLTVTAPNTITLSLLLGDGHGNFQQGPTQPSLPQGLFPGPAYLADVDGDGKLDLVFAYELPIGTSSSLVWMKNTGNGSFATPTALASIAGDNGPFLIADFNKDGRPDVLYTAPGPPESLHILMNSGNGHFVDQAAGGLNGISGMAAVIDFNLDGVPDLIVQVPSGAVTLYSFAGNGNGSFTQVSSTNIGQQGFRVYQLIAGDFDHDGFPDLVGVNGETEPSHLLYLFGDGHGNFVPQEVVGPQGGWVAEGDFNGDGIPDVVVPDRFNFVSLALGRTDRNFPSALALTPATVNSLAVGDINGDGWPEILIGGDSIHAVPGTVFLNQKNNSFQQAAYVDPGAFSLADLTGKGVADLLGGQGSNLVIWPNNGTLDFSSSPITVPQPMSNILVADLDGDGLADILSGCSGSPCPGQIFWGTGSYQFTPVTVPNIYSPFLVGDINGDGRLDFIAAGRTFLNMGGRQFQEVDSQTPYGYGTMAVAGDFNGDGIDDLALNLPGSVVISIWYGNGDGTFYQGTQIDPGQYPGAIEVGDFNGDGKVDLAVGLMLSHEVCLFLNTGQGQFTRSYIASGADAIGMVATDLNRDGKPDLAIANFMLGFRPANVDVVFHK